MKGLKHLGVIAVLVMGFLFPTLADGLTVGDTVPDFTLTNHKGGKTSLSDFKGKGVVVSFLFTQCPDPQKCPMIRKKLESLANLTAKIGAADKVQILAVTIDPERDTPEVLKRYAQGFDQTQNNWLFLTGDKNTIAKVAGAFGVIYWDEKGTIQHNLRTVFIGPDGRLKRSKSGNDWKPGEFAAEIDRDLKASK